MSIVWQEAERPERRRLSNSQPRFVMFWKRIRWPVIIGWGGSLILSLIFFRILYEVFF